MFYARIAHQNLTNCIRESNCDRLRFSEATGVVIQLREAKNVFRDLFYVSRAMLDVDSQRPRHLRPVVGAESRLVAGTPQERPSWIQRPPRSTGHRHQSISIKPDTTDPTANADPAEFGS